MYFCWKQLTMNKNRIEQLLAEKNIPATAMRILVLDLFLKNKKAFTLADLEKFLLHSDRSTLYRTLKTFEKKGVLHSIQENNTTNYLLCRHECLENEHHDLHLHFYCNVCGETQCLDEVELGKIQIPENYRVQQLKFTANGICKNC